jgi:hypothetical protein
LHYRSPESEIDLTDQPVFGSSATSDPLTSAVSCVQSVTNDNNCNGFGGSFDPSTVDQVNFSDLMKLIEDQDSSCFAETGASQLDLNLSLDYLLNCKSSESGVSQAGSMQFVPMPNISLSTDSQLTLSRLNAKDVGQSADSLRHLPSGDMNILLFFYLIFLQQSENCNFSVAISRSGAVDDAADNVFSCLICCTRFRLSSRLFFDTVRIFKIHIFTCR